MVRLIQLSHDWKASLDGSELQAAIGRMANHKIHVYNVPQDNIDETVYLLCSEHLELQQVTDLWEEGDLYIGDKEYWEAEDFPQLLRQIQDHRVGEEIEEDGDNDDGG